MIIVGKEGCAKCLDLKTKYPNIRYIEIPSRHLGLGDTICDITCFFGFKPCKGCRLRQLKLNKIVPYKWNIRKTHIKLIQLKNLVYNLGARQFPVILNDDRNRLLTIEDLDLNGSQNQRILHQ